MIPEGKWDIDSVLDDFEEETVEFVSGYLGGIGQSQYAQEQNKQAKSCQNSPENSHEL